MRGGIHAGEIEYDGRHQRSGREVWRYNGTNPSRVYTPTVVGGAGRVMVLYSSREWQRRLFMFSTNCNKVGFMELLVEYTNYASQF